MQLTVGPDGRVEVPGAEPGQTVTVEIAEAPEKQERLTLTTARTDEERDEVIAEIRRAAQELKRAAGISDDERLSLTHGALLYDEDGLPA
jgi:hypothetical protein